jgi:membrane protease subunit HflC
MKKTVAGIFIVLALLVLFTSAYTVNETEQAIITQFGKPVGDPVTKAGLNFKVPMIQVANRIDKRVLSWDGAPTSMPTKDKLYISVDTFARWRIKDPLQFFLRLRDIRSASSRLDDILGSETRNAVARHELIEIIRTTADRVPEVDEEIAEASRSTGRLKPIQKGRMMLEKSILAAAETKLAEFGIELLDVRFKRIDYNTSVKNEIYQRMISERQQIAERFRSEGAGEAAKILGDKERDMLRIESEAYREVLTVRGTADAKATQVYADAYNSSPEAIKFYEFLQTMEVYKSILGKDTTMVLSTDSDLFKYLKNIAPDVAPVPAPAAAAVNADGGH